ncbi:MAG TPA: hypothetical protein VL463_02185 [Kofleriaceae bacterium]|nr:hypothetical protein [Kofleriaceae bacterium]
MTTRSAARRRRQALLLAILLGGALALCGAVVLIAHLRATHPPGQPSPRDVVTRMIDRATAGDVDGVAALTGGEGLMHLVLDCKSQQLTRALDEMHRDQRDIARLVVEWQKLSAHVAAIDPDGEVVTTLAVGQDPPGCHVKTEIAHEDLRVTLATGGTTAQVFVRVLRVDGRWYLDRLPAAPSSR